MTQAEADDLKAKVDIVIADAVRYKRLLDDAADWMSGHQFTGGDGNCECASCGEVSWNGHAKDCELAGILARIEHADREAAP